MELTEEDKNLMVIEGKVQLVLNKTEKPNSYEVGKAGRRFKIYFDDQADLMAQLKEKMAAGMLTEEDWNVGSQ